MESSDGFLGCLDSVQKNDESSIREVNASRDAEPFFDYIPYSLDEEYD